MNNQIPHVKWYTEFTINILDNITELSPTVQGAYPFFSEYRTIESFQHKIFPSTVIRIKAEYSLRFMTRKCGISYLFALYPKTPNRNTTYHCVPLHHH